MELLALFFEIAVLTGIFALYLAKPLPISEESKKHTADIRKRFEDGKLQKTECQSRQARIEQNTHNRVVEYMNRNNSEGE